MLELSSEAVTFEASNSLSDIFFDDLNEKICTVRGNGAMGVTARGPSPSDLVSFRLKDEGKIKIMKFSPGCDIVVVQRESSKADLAILKGLTDGSVPVEFSQSCKMRNATILGLEWVSSSELLFITNQGLELYHVMAEKRAVKLLKTYNLFMNWFVYNPKYRMLLASSGNSMNIINPFVIQNGVISRIPNFKIELPSTSRVKLLARDVSVATIYGIVYVLILRHSSSEGVDSEVLLYEVNPDGSQGPRWMHTLNLSLSGKFALHVMDNLVVVHHQANGVSLVFDIKIGGSWSINSIATTHGPLIGNVPIAIPSQISTDPDCSYEPNIELYAPSWVVLQPDLIIDAKVGCMWRLILKLEPTIELIPEKKNVVEFLLSRRSSMRLLLKVIREQLESQSISLGEVVSIFDSLTDAYAENVRDRAKNESGAVNSKTVIEVEKFIPVCVEQPEIYSSVFHPLTEIKQMLCLSSIVLMRKLFCQLTAKGLFQGKDLQFLIDCMLQYLLSLQDHRIDPQPFLHEILVSSLVKCRNFGKLQQLLQYRVIADAKPLAFLLLSLEAKHAALVQLAVDMLSRIGTAAEEIVEVLLSKHRVVDAIRYLESLGQLDKVNPLKLVEAAWKCDRQTKFAVFSHFQERNAKAKGSLKFASGEQYENYLREFKKLYGKGELDTAKSQSDFAKFLEQ